MLAVLRQRNAALLWSAGLISVLGDWLLLLGLPYYVYALSGSVLATGAALAAGTLPRILVAPAAGVFVDRWDRRRTMIAADVARALLLLPLLAVRSADALWLVYVVQFVEQATGQFFTPAKRALVPRLVPRQHLAAANALDELALGAGRLLGPPLGGALLGLLGFESVVLLDAGSFLVSAVLLASIAVEPAAAQSHQLGLRSQGSQSGAVRSPSSPRPGSGWPATRARRCTLWCSAGSVWPAVWREWLAGLRLLRGQRVLVTLFGLKALVMVAYGIVFVLLVVFVRDVRGGGPLELAWFTTAQGLGTVLGSAVAGRLGRAVAPGRLFAAGLAAVGIGFVATFNAPALPLALASILVAGAGLVGSAVGERTLLQTRVADAYRGRAFATYDTGGAGLMLVGQGVAAVLGPAAGVAAALDVAGALYLAAAVGAHALLPRVREPSEE